jgi:hypothetical protein
VSFTAKRVVASVVPGGAYATNLAGEVQVPWAQQALRAGQGRCSGLI